ncbi:MAG: succinate dehydrogenase [Candidatus Omnitrophica bacterium]|nr:succinate dehydrogenase [Candidatus Omnitrophota bacterium]
MRSSYGSRQRPSGGVELFTWLFMRYSGVLLLFLALGHLFIMHVFNSIHQIDYDFVVRRYMALFWRGYDLCMLWLAMIHGLNGMRILIDDYLKPPWQGRSVKVLYVTGGLFLLLGTWVIICFQPAAG